MNKCKKAIEQAYQYTQVLHLYGSMGYDEADHFNSFVLQSLASEDVDTAVQGIKDRFLECIDILELRRGEWLVEDAPRVVAETVESAKR